MLVSEILRYAGSRLIKSMVYDCTQILFVVLLTLIIVWCNVSGCSITPDFNASKGQTHGFSHLSAWLRYIKSLESGINYSALSVKMTCKNQIVLEIM